MRERIAVALYRRGDKSADGIIGRFACDSVTAVIALESRGSINALESWRSS
jgi:hypothetical protein